MNAPCGPTIGVEEEYFLVDPRTRAVQPAAERVLTRAAARLGDQVGAEFSRYQVEVKIPPCADAESLHANALGLRTELAEVAAAEGLVLCASGTPVLGGQESAAAVGDHPRYQAGIDQYRAMLDDFAVCALHVHVEVADRELAVLVGNHLRPWLPVLVALSANSPFHLERDTGYASWRAVVRSRFPCLGPPPYAESWREYHEMSTAMAQLEVMLDPGLPFWDVRPNPHVPTIEVRCMDVTADLDDMVALAVLIRALVTTTAARVVGGDPGPRPVAELLRAAYWRAARDGWSGQGIDPLSGRVVPVAELTAGLVDQLTPALQQHRDFDRVSEFLERLAARGSGADRQRAALAQECTLAGVVDDLVARTSAGAAAHSVANRTERMWPYQPF